MKLFDIISPILLREITHSLHLVNLLYIRRFTKRYEQITQIINSKREDEAGFFRKKNELIIIDQYISEVDAYHRNNNDLKKYYYTEKNEKYDLEQLVSLNMLSLFKIKLDRGEFEIKDTSKYKFLSDVGRLGVVLSFDFIDMIMDRNDHTYVIEAIHENNADVLKALIPFDAPSEYQPFPSYIAGRQILEYAVDKWIGNKYASCAEIIAVLVRSVQCCGILQHVAKKICNKNIQSNKKKDNKYQERSITMFRRLVGLLPENERYGQINLRDSEGQTILMWFVVSDIHDNDMVRLMYCLIKTGYCLIDAQDNMGNTALLLAIQNKRYQTFLNLLKLGCRVDILNNNGDGVEMIIKNMVSSSIGTTEKDVMIKLLNLVRNKKAMLLFSLNAEPDNHIS